MSGEFLAVTFNQIRWLKDLNEWNIDGEITEKSFSQTVKEILPSYIYDLIWLDFRVFNIKNEAL